MKAKLAVLVAVPFLWAGALEAQTPPTPRPPAPGASPAAAPPPFERPDPIGENLFPPELVMQHQRALELQPEQKTYLREEMRKAQLRFTELQWELQDTVEAMGLLLEQTSVPEERVLAQLDKVLEFERQIKRTQITLMVRIKNKLTPEQQARLRELRPVAPPAPPAAPARPARPGRSPAPAPPSPPTEPPALD